MTTQEKNKAAVRRLYEDMLNTGHLDQLSEIVSPNYTGPRGEKGVAGFTATVTAVRNGIPDIHWTIDDLVASEDKVVIRWTWTGTHNGTMVGFAPTGRHVTNRAIAIYTFNHGLITSVAMESDRLGFLQQIGAVATDIIPAPPAKH